MYTDYYGLTSDPFRLSPDHTFCVRHPSFSKARAYMQFAVQRAEGFVMITGRPGTGKTTLIEDVLSELEGREIVSAKLVSAQLDADDLLRLVAFNFGIPAQGMDKSDLLLGMQGFLADRIADGQQPLLVIDEAQGLSFSALEELRLLTNLRMNGQPMLQIFLVGQDELLGLVQDKRLEQLHQRLIAACHLEPLNIRETATYVMHRLKVSGWRGSPKLRPKMFPILQQFSQGIPRRINLFMGRMLMHGWLEERQELTQEDAEIVLRELRSEHLAPIHSDVTSLILEEPPSTEGLDDILAVPNPAPDQRLGAQLLDRAETARTAPAGFDSDPPATASLLRSRVRLRRDGPAAAAEIRAPEPPPADPSEQAPRTGSLWKRGAALAAGAILGAGVVLGAVMLVLGYRLI
jgi:type II secretory pathway predicted ATPase ExeA